MAQNLDELFDVVDEQDRVLRQAPRREVHAQHWLHRAVHVLVRNRAGLIFLHQRSRLKDLFPGAWDTSCAGHVGAGEDYDSTSRRELEEELGCRPAVPPRRLFRIEAQPDTGWEFVWVYLAEDEGPFVLEADEIERGDWFTPAAIDRWIAAQPGDFASTFPLLWRQARHLV